MENKNVLLFLLSLLRIAVVLQIVLLKVCVLFLFYCEFFYIEKRTVYRHTFQIHSCNCLAEQSFNKGNAELFVNKDPCL